MVAAAGASDSKIDNLRDAFAKLGEISENEKAVHRTLPNSYVRAEAERSRLDEVVPVVDLTNPDRAAVVAQIGAACSSHGFFQRLQVQAMAVADDFFRLSPVERAKIYFDDPAKKMQLPTSLEVQDWLDFLRLHGKPFEQFVPEWPVNPPPFSDVVSPYLNQVRELGFRIYAAIWENPRTNAPMINHTDQLQIIQNEDVEQLGILGSGAFGTVYHAKWKGADVAVKRFRAVPSSEQAQEFWREADILSKLHHPNVVGFYGVVKDGPGGTLATLTEFMVNGSLGNVLRSKDKGLDLRKRLIIAMDAAIGMEYLHSKNIVHFDLKSYNLLVDLRDHSRPICKVCDFGLSKIKRTQNLVSGGMRGTPLWMAPELFDGATKVTEKIDVFSFGIVMWELLTGEVPYADMPDGAILGDIMENKLRPEVPANCGPEWRMLMEQCWSPDPAARPAFTEIAARLGSMLAAANQQA